MHRSDRLRPWLRAAAPTLLAGAALLLGTAPAQAASSITGAAYDAEVTADAQVELPGAVAIRIGGNVDRRDYGDETVVGFVLEPEGSACGDDAVAAFDDALAASSQIALDGPGPFSEAAVLEDVPAGAATLCAYLFDAGGDTHATGRYHVDFGEGEDPGSADPVAGGDDDEGASDDDGSGLDDETADDDAAASAPVCSFSRAPKKASRKLTLDCPGLDGSVTLVASGAGKTRSITVTLRDGRARVKAKRLGLGHKRSTTVTVLQDDLELAEVKLKLRR